MAVRQGITPAEVIDALNADGGAPSNGAVHNMMGRLHNDNVLRRQEDGLYKLASDSGAGGSDVGPHENESENSLSRNGLTQEDEVIF